MQVVPAGLLRLWPHPEALPVRRTTPEMACGKRPTPVAADITDAVMDTGPRLVGSAAAAVASTEPKKRGGGGPSAPNCRSMVVGLESSGS